MLSLGVLGGCFLFDSFTANLGVLYLLLFLLLLFLAVLESAGLVIGQGQTNLEFSHNGMNDIFVFNHLLKRCVLKVLKHRILIHIGNVYEPLGDDDGG